MVRALNRALPMLRAGKSLKFAYLPDGMDPDDMVRKKSVKALQEEINGAKPFVWSLWQMLLDGRTLDTPERLAKLEKDAMETVAKIVDERVRAYYQKEIQKRLKNLTLKGKKRFFSTSLISPTDSPQLLAYLIVYPQECSEFIEEIMRYFHFSNETLQTVLETLVSMILENSQVMEEDLWMALNEIQQKTLQESIHQIKKCMPSAEDVVEAIRRLLRESKKNILQKELTEKTQEFLLTESPDLKQELEALKTEMAALTKDE